MFDVFNYANAFSLSSNHAANEFFLEFVQRSFELNHEKGKTEPKQETVGKIMLSKEGVIALAAVLGSAISNESECVVPQSGNEEVQAS